MLVQSDANSLVGLFSSDLSHALDEIGSAMADMLLREQDLAYQVIAKTKLQFDGDYDVLNSTVASIPITSDHTAQRGTGSYTFLEAMVNSGARYLDIATTVESIEDLNI